MNAICKKQRDLICCALCNEHFHPPIIVRDNHVHVHLISSIQCDKAEIKKQFHSEKLNYGHITSPNQLIDISDQNLRGSRITLSRSSKTLVFRDIN